MRAHEQRGVHPVRVKRPRVGAVQGVALHGHVKLPHPLIRDRPVASLQQHRKGKVGVPLAPLMLRVLLPVAHTVAHRLSPKYARPVETTAQLPPPAAIARPFFGASFAKPFWTFHRRLLTMLPPIVVASAPIGVLSVNGRFNAVFPSRTGVRMAHLLLSIGVGDVVKVGKRVDAGSSSITVRVLLPRASRLRLPRFSLSRVLPRVSLMILLPIFTHPCFFQFVWF